MSEQHQMALALFEELAPKDLSICDAPDEVGYNRSDVFLDLTDLSLAGRRAIDVAYFIVAQSWTENKYFTRKAETEYITYIVDIEVLQMAHELYK